MIITLDEKQVKLLYYFLKPLIRDGTVGRHAQLLELSIDRKTRDKFKEMITEITEAAVDETRAGS